MFLTAIKIIYFNYGKYLKAVPFWQKWQIFKKQSLSAAKAKGTKFIKVG